ncbi:hypothetical protein HG536_0C05840 [Torulaspora globosa]|uniref:Sec39 domain-containing protein n=1 Tax=Torulaspora globosa TaxID=48254 RepID=A0A7G3ZFX9_9SACH|nr:uncharacterized protein HG536_0C05840 [Torulaspora globosa]QLL32415.1 hypothetical protein HG536_0C05840 [Torulaspora globosa]
MDSISDYQFFLLIAVFAARRDAGRLAQLLPSFTKQPDFYDAVGVLWPELDDPARLKFLFEIPGAHNADCEELLIQVIDSDEKLIPIVEMEHSILQERYRATRNYVESRLKEIPDCKALEFDTFEAKWMRRRMILCNRYTPEEATSYRPLWSVVKSDVNFDKWIEGIVQPLQHINRRLSRTLTIEAFEAMGALEAFKLILKTEPDFPSTVIHREVIPYLTNLNLYDLFLENIFTEVYFPLNSTGNIRNFSYLYAELCKVSPSAEANSRVQAQAAQIIFDNSSGLLKIASLHDVQELLSKIDDKVEIANYGITVGLLKHYSKCMESIYKNYSLKEIYSIAQEETLGQQAHFSAIVREQVLGCSDNGETVQAISQLLDASNPEEEHVFKNLTLDQKMSVFIETVLEMGKFELLDSFLTEFDSAVDEEVLIKYFWHFFNRASNGLRSRPEMKNARRTLNLLLKTNKTKYEHLEALLDVANDLSTYSLNLGKGIPFKPSDLLTFAPRIFDLIALLLELNVSLYKNMAATLRIVENLQIGLQLKRRDDQSSSETVTKLLALHIDHSLANLDFEFALDGARELLEMSNISSFWPTIFQVGKFVDPRWPDEEAPVDVLMAQLEILGDLLRSCPVEEVEAVASQWSAIELELLTRDPALASLSTELEGPTRSLQDNVLSGVLHAHPDLLSHDLK